MKYSGFILDIPDRLPRTMWDRTMGKQSDKPDLTP